MIKLRSYFMKKINMALITMVTMSGLAYAGGDIVESIFEEEVISVPVEPVAPVVAPIVPPKPQDIDVNGLYVALGLTLAQFDPRCNCNGHEASTDKTAGVIGRVGYDFNQYVGVEARGIRTNWKANGGTIKHLGLFVKPMYPVSTDVNVYALGGYAKTTTPSDIRRVDANTFAWGAGLEYDLAKDVKKDGLYDRAFDGYGDQEGGFGLFADYERLVQKSGSPDFDTINFGLTYDF